MLTPSNYAPAPSFAQVTPSTSTSIPSQSQSTTFRPDPDSSYTPFYCEENIYQLIQGLVHLPNIRLWACFVSNLNRTALLFNQRASKQTEEEGSYVIWDYHVFAVAAIREAERKESFIVLDRDSSISYITDLKGTHPCFSYSASDIFDGTSNYRKQNTLQLRSRPTFFVKVSLTLHWRGQSRFYRLLDRFTDSS